eukprot:9691584-Ditylum_brightwellii.AAC.1
MSSLIKRNKLHLNQAFDAPFVNDPTKDYIGEFEMSSSANNILDGNFDLNIEEILLIPVIPKYGIRNPESKTPNRYHNAEARRTVMTII